MRSFDEIVSFDGAEGTTVAVAGADDRAVLGAVEAGTAAGIEFILIGDSESIRKTANEAGVSLAGTAIESPADGTEAELCRHAAILCRTGRAQVMMKGKVGTASFTRAILDSDSGLMLEKSLLSHVALFADPRNGRPFLITDSAINIAPDVEAKKRILSNAADVARILKADIPKIALLAPVEKVSSKISSTKDAAELKEWVNSGGIGKALANGPIALDVAASPEAAAAKGVGEDIAGRVDILLAPNLDAGNILYKALSVYSGAPSAGILVGAAVPVVLTSRSDSDESKIRSLALALTVASGLHGD